MFLAVRDVWFARGRFALMAAAIALITVLVVMLTGLTQGLARASTSAITGLPVDQLAWQRSESTMTASRLTDADLVKAKGVRGVQDAALVGVATTRMSFGASGLPVTVFGIDPGSVLAPIALRPGQVIVSSALAADHDIAVGDTVSIGGQQLRVQAVGADWSFSHTPVVWAPRTVWAQTQGGFEAAGAGSILLLRTGSGFDGGVFEQDTGLVARGKSAALTGIGSYSAENGSLTMIRVLLIAISALVIGAFFTVWTVQREGDLAVLKAIGARTGYLVKDALGQALLTMVVGGGIGTAVALVLGLAVRGHVPVVVDARTVALPFGLLVVVGLLGAAVALRRIVRVDPMQALAGVR